MRSIILLSLLALSTGCAHYEYDIVAPENLRGHIGTKGDHVVTVDPLTYRFRTVDNRLVIRIYNDTQDPIVLLGERSTVVTPDQQSHPVRPQTIAPGSFIKLIFPPLRPPYGPRGVFGVGIGARVDRDRGDPGYIPPDPYYYDARDYYDDPRFLAAYVPDQTIFWDWEGESDVTATFVYLRRDKIFEHRFVFHRKKM
jgi:hypothetical protein